MELEEENTKLSSINTPSRKRKSSPSTDITVAKRSPRLLANAVKDTSPNNMLRSPVETLNKQQSSNIKKPIKLVYGAEGELTAKGVTISDILIMLHNAQ